MILKRRNRVNPNVVTAVIKRLKVNNEDAEQFAIKISIELGEFDWAEGDLDWHVEDHSDSEWRVEFDLWESNINDLIRCVGL